MPKESEYSANLTVSLIVDDKEVAKREQQNMIVTATERAVATTLANEPHRSPRHIDMVTGEEVWLDGFKILVKDRGRYYSISLGVGLRQEYRVGKPTKRRKGKWGALTVFNTLEAARFFANDQRTYKKQVIYTCQWLPASSSVKGIYLPFERWNASWKTGSLNMYIETKTTDGRIMLKQKRIPNGTMFAEEVIILQRV